MGATYIIRMVFLFFINFYSLMKNTYLINCCLYTHFIVHVIIQPDNATTCEQGSVVFTCVMDIQNVNISKENVKWWRTRINDHEKYLVIAPAVKRYSITNSINEQILTSVLMIGDVRKEDVGPYWPGLTGEDTLCNMAFLSIVPNGMIM